MHKEKTMYNFIHRIGYVFPEHDQTGSPYNMIAEKNVPEETFVKAYESLYHIKF